ncbi:hypothetical protein DPMN_038191 [Dreissena polymorpha]|uniref:Uncharacterized protein n=1 Tax=Dreissena polymorpha TaxID=45954 RepID=A0A9D4RNF2_DREPO|nr:hypothetical protein DPMN_038191 [Dreissena polymorpha]
MADTGCQRCLASLNVIYRLMFRESDLIAVTMRITELRFRAFNDHRCCRQTIPLS